MGTTSALAEETTVENQELISDVDHLIHRIATGKTRTLNGYNRRLMSITEKHQKLVPDVEALLVRRYDDDMSHEIQRSIAPDIMTAMDRRRERARSGK